jgi:predicted nuclease of predicted toxin-antitoxin system
MYATGIIFSIAKNSLMKFLANENFPFPSIQLLRSNNYSVQSIAEDLPGIKDEKIIEIAVKENLIILTFDKDYGELIFKYSSLNPPDVVFFRYKGKDPLFAGMFLVQLLSDNSIAFEKYFTVIDENNIRQRKY